MTDALPPCPLRPRPLTWDTDAAHGLKVAVFRAWPEVSGCAVNLLHQAQGCALVVTITHHGNVVTIRRDVGGTDAAEIMRRVDGKLHELRHLVETAPENWPTMNDHEPHPLKRLGREIFQAADDEPPTRLWSSYVAAFSDVDAFAAHWPAIVELANSGRRDWYALEKMRVFPEEMLDLIAAGLPGSSVDRPTVDNFAALYAWWGENRFKNAASDGSDPDAIPF